MGADRVWPLGVADQQVLTHGEFTQLDLNASRALAFFDVKANNWTRHAGPFSGVRVVDRVASEDLVNKRIFAFGNGAAANGAIWWARIGESNTDDWTQANVTGPAGHAPTFSWMVTNPAGITLAGGDMSGSTTDNVIQRSTNGHDFPHQSLPGGWTGTRCGLWDATNSLWIVAGMAAGEIATSPDGITWTVRTVPAPANTDVFWACDVDPTGKSFFQGDNGHGIRSDNGTTWTSSTATISSPRAVRYNASDDLWMVVGAGGELITSPDRITWTTIALGDFDLLDLACDGRLWVAAGVRTDGTLMSGAVYSLDRGVHWSFVALADTSSEARGIRHLRNSFWLAAPNNSDNLSNIYRSLRIGVDAFNNLG